MAATKFAVIRDENTKEIVRIIFNDEDDSHIDRARSNLRAHESIHVFNLADHAARHARAMKEHLPP